MLSHTADSNVMLSDIAGYQEYAFCPDLKEFLQYLIEAL